MANLYRKWTVGFLGLALTMLIGAGAVIAVIDPYFHYHRPLTALQYPINNQRYQNNGIVKHFKYDAIITGTSMTENFKVSEFDRLFGAHSIKVPFSGGSYKEINENLKVAIAHNTGIKYIVRCLDYSHLLDAANSMRYENDKYPWHLYDEYFYNDAEYVFNKSILMDALSVIDYTKKGGITTDFDNYSNWMHLITLGKNRLMSRIKGQIN